MGLSDAYSRMVRSLFPRGRAITDDPGSVVSKVSVALSDELVRIHLRGLDMIEESDPRTCNETVSDHEIELGISGSGTLQDRRNNIVSFLLSEEGFRPDDFKNALAPVLGLSPTDVIVIEISRSDAVASGDERQIFRFFIRRDPSLPGTFSISSAQHIVDQMAPSHTQGFVIVSDNFLTDDPDSLTDRDILGV